MRRSLPGGAAYRAPGDPQPRHAGRQPRARRPGRRIPACALALNATFILLSKKGERHVKATEFFKGLFETDLKSAEILAAAEFPSADRSVFAELARRHGDYAIIGLATAVKDGDRRFVFFGAGATPVVAKNASKAKSLGEAKEALGKDLAPPADLYHSSAQAPSRQGPARARMEHALDTTMIVNGTRVSRRICAAAAPCRLPAR